MLEKSEAARPNSDGAIDLLMVLCVACSALLDHSKDSGNSTGRAAAAAAKGVTS